MSHLPYSFNQAGGQNLLLEVDPGNTIREYNKNNNTVRGNVNVTADPSDPKLRASRAAGQGGSGGGNVIRPSSGM
jgi:subtilase family serine protease